MLHEILEKDLFEKCYSILGYIVISESFGINKALFKILKLNLFEKLHNVLGYNTVFMH